MGLILDTSALVALAKINAILALAPVIDFGAETASRRRSPRSGGSAPRPAHRLFEPYDPARHEQVATRGELQATGA